MPFKNVRDTSGIFNLHGPSERPYGEPDDRFESETLVSGVSSTVSEGLDFYETFPRISDLAQFTVHTLHERLHDERFMQSVRTELFEFIAQLRLSKASNLNSAFEHFIGNAANGFISVLRNRATMKRYEPVLNELPVFARALRIITLKSPRQAYFHIVAESEKRMFHHQFSWQEWLVAVSSSFH